MKINTHDRIDPSLCGTPVFLKDGESRVEFTPAPSMAVDDTQLVHGGFIFGLADYAAMIAVNHPNVVLGAASVKFLKPVVAGEKIVAEAVVQPGEGKKKIVKTNVKRGEEVVFEGEFTCFTPDQHVLK